MEKLGFYPLTIVLSYLTENDSVSLLLTKRKFAKQILPIFRLPEQQPQPLKVNVDDQQVEKVQCNDSNYDESCHGSRPTSNYKYQAIKYKFKVSPVQDPNVLLDRLNTRRLCRRQHNDDGRHRTTGQSTSEIAYHEWQQSWTEHIPSYQFSYPSELELLRFRSNHDYDQYQNNNHIPDLFRCNGKTTLIVSYPRSGNTLVRTLLERTMGYVTGSDTRPDRSLSKELSEQHGLIGEGSVASSRVMFVKTHYPERIGNQIFHGHAAILLIRNPYDAIDSYWNMNATKSHTKSLIPSMYDTYRDMWHGLVRNEIHIWNKFLDYWLSDTCPIPVLLVRFEDLIRNPRFELERMMKFTVLHHGQDQLQHSTELSNYWLQRIQHVTTSQTNIESLGSYQPRSSSSGITSIGKSIRKGHYTTDLLEYIQNVCEINHSENYLRRFGYDTRYQNFPNNFIDPKCNGCINDSLIGTTSETLHTHNEIDVLNDRVVRVNDGKPIRPIDCPYGRLLQQWRHSVTNNDMNPLPTTTK
jgi:hypothetical protein